MTAITAITCFNLNYCFVNKHVFTDLYYYLLVAEDVEDEDEDDVEDEDDEVDPDVPAEDADDEEGVDDAPEGFDALSLPAAFLYESDR